MDACKRPILRIEDRARLGEGDVRLGRDQRRGRSRGVPGLVLRDHTGAALAQLTAAGNARFDGRSVAGEPITLYR